MVMEDLINRTLRPGDSIRVGRKSLSEVTINRPYFSGVHCEIDVTFAPHDSSPNKLSCGVCDRSSNGTWLVRLSSNGIGQSSLDETEVVRRNATRLKKGVREELTCGDCVLLLSPLHPDCRHFRFVLERGPHDQEFVFRQLPFSLHGAGAAHRGMDPPSSGRNLTTPTLGVKRGPDGRDTPPVTTKILRLDNKNIDANCLNFELKTNCKESTDNKETEDFGHHGDYDHSSTSPEENRHEPPVELRHEPPVELRHEPSVELCPVCHDWFPVLELISHVDSCTSIGGEKDKLDDDVVEIEGRVVTLRSGDPADREYTLDSYEGTHRDSLTGDVHNDGSPDSLTTDPRHEHNTIDVVKVTAGVPSPKRALSDAVQCPLCFEMFALSAVETHSVNCSGKDIDTCSIEEHCQHCLKIFPLNVLVSHSLNCSQNKYLGSLDSEVEVSGVMSGAVSGDDVWGEPVERCMHCFRDFPLSKLVAHSQKCEGDMLGPRERFRGFLPSVHDMDPMALSVLNETQMAAVEYVMERSKVDSECVYTDLKSKVLSLGYSERDLARTLQWIRQDAPIIVHVNLDRVLRFLTEDTHYRNLFEVGTGGGSTDKHARRSWEDRIFNNIYSSSTPGERVKYGVLNIVGDPRGVQSCYHYGDSFLQLKKVRLRTTFASADTSHGAVQLSCCEHYGNVLNQYSSAELQAILDVATRKKMFLRSDMISQYKEVQIHGPVCLSENVDCIVVNEHHAPDTPTRELLDKFVERNKCNLVWMEPHDSVGYPSFTATHTTTPFLTMPAPVLPTHPYASHYHTAPAALVPTHDLYRRAGRRRRGRHRDFYWST